MNRFLRSTLHFKVADNLCNTMRRRRHYILWKMLCNQIAKAFFFIELTQILSQVTSPDQSYKHFCGSSFSLSHIIHFRPLIFPTLPPSAALFYTCVVNSFVDVWCCKLEAPQSLPTPLQIWQAGKESYLCKCLSCTGSYSPHGRFKNRESLLSLSPYYEWWDQGWK